MPLPLAKSLDQLQPADATESGGKAYNCARLKQGGFPVPDALVVAASASQDDIDRLVTHPWFERWPPDATFAVRSSGIDEDHAEHSFAGIHETKLFVARPDLLAAVAACRASARSSQATIYRRASGVSTDVSDIAVLVQRMIQPVASGVAFTINPLTGASDELVVNSSWGVGETLVGGYVDPDEFRLRKRDGARLSSRLGDKGHDRATTPSLTKAQLGELAALLVAIERHFDKPQDVEWCYDGSAFWILQSRPITTNAGDGSDPEWSRANLAEVYPELASPQALSATEEVLNIAERRHMGRLLAPQAGPMFKSFYGRLYLNVSQLRHMSVMGGTPPSAALMSIGHPEEIRPEDERLVQAPFRERLRCLPDVIRLASRHLRAKSLTRAQESRTAQMVARLSSVDPATLSDERIWSTIEEWRERAPRSVEVVLILAGVLVYEAPLRKICSRVGFSFERLLYSHLAAGERSVSAQQAFDLVALADVARRDPAALRWLRDCPLDLPTFRREHADSVFLREFDRFLDRYGHRGLFESDWALPRYREDPSPLLQALRMHVGGKVRTETAGGDKAAEAAAVFAEFERAVPVWRRWFVVPQARLLVARIKQYYLWREKCRSNIVRVMEVLRKFHLVLARRFHERGWIDGEGDYFLLHLDEVGRALGGERDAIRRIVTRRRLELEEYGRLQMPLLMRESQLPLLLHAPPGAATDDGAELRGLPVSRGSVEAEVVVLDNPGNVAAMRRGAILVARATDPSWTPLFTLASGVIVEVGGLLSHASTIAREYGLPAVANVKGATTRLHTGERVKLDADRGVIRRVS